MKLSHEKFNLAHEGLVEELQEYIDEMDPGYDLHPLLEGVVRLVEDQAKHIKELEDKLDPAVRNEKNEIELVELRAKVKQLEVSKAAHVSKSTQDDLKLKSKDKRIAFLSAENERLTQAIYNTPECWTNLKK